MKRIYLLFLLSLCFFITPAQEKDKAETLDNYFAGVPLKEDFSKWYSYVHDHLYLGIDSIGKRGYYSSFKPGIKSHFPFPDSLQVKLLFKRTIFQDSATHKNYDSVLTIMIEGVFPDNKAGRKGSQEVFTQLRKKLSQYYKQRARSNDGFGIWFKKGKSENFPDCSLWHGYEENKKFYYVLIGYDFPVRKEHPWYLDLIE